MRSTFSGLNMALLGLNASQKALDVTGQNLTNINTAGYTRQRLDQASISPTGAEYFNTRYSAKAGQGVLMTGVSQIRDPFLDIRFRNQLSKVGTVDAKDQVLTNIGEIFDNVDVSTVQNALDEVGKQLQTISTKVGENGNDNLVRSSVEVLLSYIHQNAVDLNKVRSDLEQQLKTAVVPDVNQILKSIQELNGSIKSSQILGNPALELKDQRNALIDDLATYLPIEVVYGKETIGSGREVETLSIKLKGTFGDPAEEAYLVSDGKSGSLEYVTGADGKAGLKLNYLNGEGDSKADADISDKLSEGILKGDFDMLNKEGIFDGTQVKGIGYYQKMFDSFVNTLASGLNEMNTFRDADGNILYNGGALFETSDGSDVFTAENIKVSDGWMNGTVKLVPSENAVIEGNTDADNILKMKAFLSTEKITFYAYDKDGNQILGKDGKPIVVFEGNMPSAYANIQAEQGIEKMASKAILENHITVLSNAADARDSVMGVNLDEEVMNLMRYQQSYSAAARLMTVMDEALDKLINGTGVVGR